MCFLCELIADHSAVNIGLARIGSSSKHADGKGVTIHQVNDLEEGMEYDTIRTDILELYGLTVLRFSNRDIGIQFNKVCAEIDTKVKEATHK